MATMKHFRAEHAHLMPHVDELRSLADALDGPITESQREAIGRAETWLHDGLVPHAQVEDAVLYPAVAELIERKDATAPMTHDHERVGMLIGELAKARASGDLKELRRTLYSLHAIVAAHFDKEEALYLPLLESRLSDREMAELEERLEHGAPAHAGH